MYIPPKSESLYFHYCHTLRYSTKHAEVVLLPIIHTIKMELLASQSTNNQVKTIANVKYLLCYLVTSF